MFVSHALQPYIHRDRQSAPMAGVILCGSRPEKASPTAARINASYFTGWPCSPSSLANLSDDSTVIRKDRLSKGHMGNGSGQ